MARFSPALFPCMLWATLVPLAQAQQVTLPLSDYEALRQRTQLDPIEVPPPAASLALESAELEIELGEESARLRHRLALTVFSQDWQELALGDAGSFISAELGELEGRLDTAEEGVSLRLKGQGRHEVRLESVLALETDENATREIRHLRLGTPPAAVVRGRLVAGTEVEEVELSGDGALSKIGAGEWWFIARGEVALAFEMRGVRRTPERALLPLRFDARSATWTEVGRTQVRVTGRVEARILQGQLERLRVALPEGASVVGVDGATAGWDVVDGHLEIVPLEPARESFLAEVEMRMPATAELPSPVLRPEDSVRTRHLTSVSVEGDGLLELLDGDALRSATRGEVATLPESVRSGRRFFALKEPGRAPRWRVEWAAATEVLAAQVDRLLVDIAVGESGEAGYQLWAELRSRGARHLRIRPPAGFAMIEARRDGAPVVPGDSGGAFAIPLGTRNRWVHLSGTLPLDLAQDGSLRLELPEFSAPVARVDVRAVLPGGRSYELVDAARAGSAGRPPNEIRPASRRLRSNHIAGQMMWLGELESRRAQELWPSPGGFEVLEATWSALSEAPGPLLVEINQQKESASWF